MNSSTTSKTLLFSCWLSMGLPSLSIAAPLPQPSEVNNGTVVLYDKDNTPCTLTAPPKSTGASLQYEFTRPDYSAGCTNNSARTLAIYEMPSATTIKLSDGRACSDTPYEGNADVYKNKYSVELKITRNPTTTPEKHIDLLQLKTYKEGQIIKPGVLLVKKNIPEDMVDKELMDSVSCVSITASKPNILPPDDIALGKRGAIFVGMPSGDFIDFKCFPNTVLKGLNHSHNMPVHGTLYTCATVNKLDKTYTTANETRSPAAKETGTEFVCPRNKVITGRRIMKQSSAVHSGLMEYYCANVINDKQEIMDVHLSNFWERPVYQTRDSFECPDNLVMVGRYTYTDLIIENEVAYRCASLKNPVTLTPTNATQPTP